MGHAEKGRWWILAACMVLVLPFLTKPLHIDEESYLFIGRAIQDNLLRPYDWLRKWQPVINPGNNSLIYAHPPIHLWLMALLLRFINHDHTWILRLCMLPFGLLLALSHYGLARHFVRSPILPTLAFISSPAILLILHQSLMIDLPCVALGLCGVWMLLEARQRSSKTLATLAGLLLGASVLTKYSALPLLLLCLLPSSSAQHRKPLGHRSLFVALALFLAWQLWTWVSYGAPHLPFVIWHAEEIDRSGLFSRVLGSVSQLGWSVIAPPVTLLLILQRKGRWHLLTPAASLSLLAILFLLQVPPPDEVPTKGVFGDLADGIVGQIPTDWWNWISLGLAIFLGFVVLQLLLEKRGPRFLRIWAVCAIGAVMFGHNFAGARYFALAASPLSLLMWRKLERDQVLRTATQWGAVAAGTLLTLWVAYSDLNLALVQANQSLAAARYVEAHAQDGQSCFFIGEWGARHIFEAHGFSYLQSVESLKVGDWIITPSVAGPGHIDGISALLRHEFSKDGTPGMRVIAPGAGIGFYSEVFGLLPYGIAATPIETTRVWQVSMPTTAP